MRYQNFTNATGTVLAYNNNESNRLFLLVFNMQVKSDAFYNILNLVGTTGASNEQEELSSDGATFADLLAGTETEIASFLAIKPERQEDIHPLLTPLLKLPHIITEHAVTEQSELTILQVQQHVALPESNDAAFIYMEHKQVSTEIDYDASRDVQLSDLSRQYSNTELEQIKKSDSIKNPIQPKQKSLDFLKTQDLEDSSSNNTLVLPVILTNYIAQSRVEKEAEEPKVAQSEETVDETLETRETLCPTTINDSKTASMNTASLQEELFINHQAPILNHSISDASTIDSATIEGAAQESRNLHEWEPNPTQSLQTVASDATEVASAISITESLGSTYSNYNAPPSLSAGQSAIKDMPTTAETMQSLPLQEIEATSATGDLDIAAIISNSKVPGNPQRTVDGRTTSQNIQNVEVYETPAATPLSSFTPEPIENRAGDFALSGSTRISDSGVNVSDSIFVQVSKNILNAKEQTTSFSLYPDSLGKVKVEFRHVDNHTRVMITAERQGTADILYIAAKQIQEMLVDSGMKAENFTMDIRSALADSGSQQNANGQSEQQWQNEATEDFKSPSRESNSNADLADKAQILFTGAANLSNVINIRV
jgi:hypothetical protein